MRNAGGSRLSPRKDELVQESRRISIHVVFWVTLVDGFKIFVVLMLDAEVPELVV